MKVLLISLNREKNPYPVVPLGVLCLADVIEKQKHETRVLDLCFSDNVKKDIASYIKEFSPDVIGVSIRNIDNLTYPKIVSYLPDIQHCIDCIKENTSSPVILGGSAFSLFPEDLMRVLKCHIGIIGEGETAFPAIIDRIEQEKEDLSGIDNVIWDSGNGLKKNKISYNSDLSGVVTRSFINNDIYSEFGGMGNLQTKRGCEFNCCYCTYPILEGKNYRLRPPDIVADEMESAYKDHDIKHFFFVDNIFNYPLGHAEEICRKIISRKLPVEWSCFANPMNLRAASLRLMKEAGCVNIEFGTDALSHNVLKKLGKSFSVEDVFKVSEGCKDAGIKSAHYVMFGGPGENEKTLNEAFSNIEKIECNAVIIMVGIRIYPGTPLEKTAIQDGIISADTNLLEPRFYLSKDIQLDILLKRVTEFASSSPKCIVPGLGIKSSEKMYKTLRRYFKEGPLWSYLGG